MYKGEADWSYIAEVKNDPTIHIPIFGNGDIDSPEKALEYRNRYGVDGIMIGRAAIGNPWIFSRIDRADITPSDLLDAVYIPSLLNKLLQFVPLTVLKMYIL